MEYYPPPLDRPLINSGLNNTYVIHIRAFVLTVEVYDLRGSLNNTGAASFHRSFIAMFTVHNVVHGWQLADYANH